MRAVRTLFVALTVCGLAAGPALAGQTVTLKPDVANSDGTVTLGDLFEGAGAAGRVPVATRTGATVVLDAAIVQQAARRAGLDWDNAQGLHRIIVHAGVAAAGGGALRAHGNVEVLTYTRSLAAGEIVQPTDLAWIKTAAAPNDAPSDADMVIGQAAKRPLRAGAVVQAHDIGAAQVIKPGDIVLVSYDSDGVSLTLEGKAMALAGVGDNLPVQNTLSKKVVQTVVIGPGQAVVGPTADQIRASRSIRYAAR
ncbi:MAG TPA: flagellar basal body P-ring formation chaperone FlgA [Phenylobacterium sp.]|jgi:flagella basal body P-ring formation protein FlgA|nr:flagellar basal body P-ring formation chaperone FlgA [Phenylobacterium sp.]